MQDNARKITFGAMMIAIFVIMLAISVYVPLLGAVMSLFIPLPILLYRLRYDRAASILVMITGTVVSLIGGLALFPVAILFGTLGLVIGDTIKSGKSKLYTSMASGLTIIIITILTYVASIFLLGINVIEESIKLLGEAQEELFLAVEKYGDIPEKVREQAELSMDLTLAVIPSAFMISSFSSAFIIVLLNLAIAKKLGHTVSNFPPFREMKLPLLTVWFYLLILLLPFFTTVEEGTTLYLIVINATFIFRFLFILQGISFVHHYLYEMKLPKWVTVISTIIAILLSPFTILLGILDIGMNIRAWIGRGKSN